MPPDQQHLDQLEKLHTAMRQHRLVRNIFHNIRRQNPEREDITDLWPPSVPSLDQAHLNHYHELVRKGIPNAGDLCAALSHTNLP